MNMKNFVLSIISSACSCLCSANETTALAAFQDYAETKVTCRQSPGMEANDFSKLKQWGKQTGLDVNIEMHESRVYEVKVKPNKTGIKLFGFELLEIYFEGDSGTHFMALLSASKTELADFIKTQKWNKYKYQFKKNDTIYFLEKSPQKNICCPDFPGNEQDYFLVIKSYEASDDEWVGNTYSKIYKNKLTWIGCHVFDF